MIDSREALAAEIRGDYLGALVVYEKATHWLDEGSPWVAGPSPSPQEVLLKLVFEQPK
jgi:hypothetical protein